MNNLGMMPDINKYKLTKVGIENYLAKCLGVDRILLTFIKMVELEKQWRHACVKKGVDALGVQSIFYPTGHIIYFTFCTACGKVLYYYE